MEGLTIQEAAATTGWSPRMLRYIESSGLVDAARSSGGYRLYGAAELQRLRTLRELLDEFEVGLSDVAFAARLQSEPQLRVAIEDWLEASAERPEHVEPAQWLAFEKRRHELALPAAGSTTAATIPSPVAATAPPVAAAKPQTTNQLERQ